MAWRRTHAGRAIADAQARKALALDAARAGLVARYADRSLASSLSLELVADRKRAAFSSWYEMFPRSASAEPGRHGTFRDVETRLAYLADMGFDVLYFPPIHPIGRINRKGANNALAAQPGRRRQPLGHRRGGGRSQGHPAAAGHVRRTFSGCYAARASSASRLRSTSRFSARRTIPTCRRIRNGSSIVPTAACSTRRIRPRNTRTSIPFDFETADWRALWLELKSIVDYWIAQGVAIFRVDNPHTKAFAFWEWLIDAVKRDHPDVIFLAEAFTRPKVMHRLAKLGFSQSYTYFTWRNTKQELTDYFTDLALGTGPPVLPSQCVAEHARYPARDAAVGTCGRCLRRG